MAKYELRLPDGTSLTALKSLTLTWQLSDAQDISLGSACAAMLEATLFGDAPIDAGTEIACYEDGQLLGSFFSQKPKRGGETLSVTAYDAMTRFDREITAFVQAQTFPIKAQALLENLCSFCGVPLHPDTVLPDETLEAFSQPGITGRQLLQHLGQLAGKLWRIGADGFLELCWFGGEPRDLTNCRQDTLRVAETPAAPIERVLIRTAENEVGALWPDGPQETANTYILQANPLLPPSADRQKVAKRLYEQLKDYRCTAFSCTLLPGQNILPGQQVRLPNGDISPVMKLTVKDGQRRIEATANQSLQSTESFNRLQLDALPGRMLTVERTAEGLKAENADIRGAAAALALKVEGITARVSSAEEKAGDYALKSQLTQLEQTAKDLSFSVTQVQQTADTKADKNQVTELTEHFRFASDGLTITNSATGMGIHISEQQVAFTGGSAPTTVITPNAMQTTNLHIDTRLDAGGFSLIPRTNRNLSLRYTAG